MKTMTLTPPQKTATATVIRMCASPSEAIATLEQRSSRDRIVVLYDRSVERIASKFLGRMPEALALAVGTGEAAKSLKEVDRIVCDMLENGCTRNTLLIACGGGMITDLAGFIGSVFMRGIETVLIPTTLLGMVDAAIGGKNAVNCGGRKNMIGTTAHPHAVLVDLSLLRELPDRQFADGMAEVIKIAAITEASFFEWLEESQESLLRRQEDTVAECVERAIAAKIRIVEQDDADQDRRLFLNFGHTVGHALESLSDYRLSHGQAISIGMIAELTLSSSACIERISALLEAFGLPCALPQDCTADALFHIMTTDKKSTGGTVRMAVPLALGEGTILSLSRKQFLTVFP